MRALAHPCVACGSLRSPFLPPRQLWDAAPIERILTHGPPITQMLFVTIPLTQLPPEMHARLAATTSAAAAPAEPSCRLVITGDEAGSVKMWDADAIIAQSGVPSLVSIARDTAKAGGDKDAGAPRDEPPPASFSQEDARDHERVEALGWAARRSSVPLAALHQQQHGHPPLESSAEPPAPAPPQQVQRQPTPARTVTRTATTDCCSTIGEGRQAFKLSAGGQRPSSSNDTTLLPPGSSKRRKRASAALELTDIADGMRDDGVRREPIRIAQARGSALMEGRGRATWDDVTTTTHDPLVPACASARSP